MPPMNRMASNTEAARAAGKNPGVARPFVHRSSGLFTTRIDQFARNRLFPIARQCKMAENERESCAYAANIA